MVTSAIRLPKFYLIASAVVCFVAIEYLFFLTLAFLSGIEEPSSIANLGPIICALIISKLLLSAIVFSLGLKARFDAVTELSFICWRKLCFQKNRLDVAPEELAARTIADVNSTVNVWLFNSLSVVCDVFLATAILGYILFHVDVVFVFPVILVVLVLGFFNFFVGQLVRFYGEKRREHEERRLALMTFLFKDPLWFFSNRSLVCFEREFASVMHGVAHYGSRSLFGQGYVKVVVEAFGLTFVALISLILNGKSGFLFEGGTVLLVGAARLVPLVSKISVARQAIANHSVAAMFIVQTNAKNDAGIDGSHSMVSGDSFEIRAHLELYDLTSNIDKIEMGQAYWLRGRSGVGKSRLLSELFHSIRASGVHSVAYMPQQPSLLPFHIKALCDEQNLKALLERFSLKRLIEELKCLTEAELRLRISKLSVGETQRIALLYTILGEEDVWLLDEPFSAIPKDQILILAAELSKACQNKTVLVASHIAFQSTKQITIERAEDVH